MVASAGGCAIATRRLAEAEVRGWTPEQLAQAREDEGYYAAMAEGLLTERAVTAMSHEQRVVASAGGCAIATRRLAEAEVRGWTPEQLARAREAGGYYAAMATQLILQRAVRVMDPSDLLPLYALARCRDVYTSAEAREYILEIVVDQMTLGVSRDLAMDARIDAVMDALGLRLASPPPLPSTCATPPCWEPCAMPPRYRSLVSRRVAVARQLEQRLRHARGPSGWSMADWDECSALSGTPHIYAHLHQLYTILV